MLKKLLTIEFVDGNIHERSGNNFQMRKAEYPILKRKPRIDCWIPQGICNDVEVATVRRNDIR